MHLKQAFDRNKALRTITELVSTLENSKLFEKNPTLKSRLLDDWSNGRSRWDREASVGK